MSDSLGMHPLQQSLPSWSIYAMMAMRGPLHADSSQPSQVRKEAATTTKAVPGQGLASF